MIWSDHESAPAARRGALPRFRPPRLAGPGSLGRLRSPPHPPAAGGSLRGPTLLSRSERFGDLRFAARYGSSDSLGRASHAHDHSKHYCVIKLSGAAKPRARDRRRDTGCAQGGPGPGGDRGWRWRTGHGVQAAPGAPRGVKPLGRRAARRKDRGSGGESLARSAARKA